MPASFHKLRERVQGVRLEADFEFVKCEAWPVRDEPGHARFTESGRAEAVLPELRAV